MKKNNLTFTEAIAGFRRRNVFRKGYFFGYKVVDINVFSHTCEIYGKTSCLGDATMVRPLSLNLSTGMKPSLEFILWDLTYLKKYFHNEITYIKNKIVVTIFEDTLHYTGGGIGIKSRLLHSNPICSLSPYLEKPLVSDHKVLKQIEAAIDTNGFKILDRMLKSHPFALFLPVGNDNETRYILWLTDIDVTQLPENEEYHIRGSYLLK